MALLGGIQGGDLPCQESYPDPAVSLWMLIVTTPEAAPCRCGGQVGSWEWPAMHRGVWHMAS
jgi:hypothetical protein